MRTPINNLLTAQKAVLENTQAISLKGVEVATRFFDLHTQAAQGMLAAGSQAPHGGPPDALAMTQGVTEYTQRAVSLGWQTQAELSQLLTLQMGRLQTFYVELLTASLLGAAHLHDPKAQPGGGRAP